MKSQKILFVLGFFLLFLSNHGQETKVMTYNIKYDNVRDTVNNWNDRKVAMVSLLEHYGPGIIGMQEVVHHQLTYLIAQLEHYRFIGVGRDDGKEKGEYSPILYNSDKYKLLKVETFWLSETPDKISVGWDAAMERICTYGLFEVKATGQKLYIFNTHFDHIGVVAREKSAALIISKMKEINADGFPLVLMGDLNLNPHQKPIQYLQKELTDGQQATEKSFYGPTGTFNGFDPDRILDERIDYIFVDGFAVKSYLHIDDRMENNKHISDHLPVMAEISTKN
jgi:endonuclease/exonuclease/phosphatase family metal-dependent hydrolase